MKRFITTLCAILAIWTSGAQSHDNTSTNAGPFCLVWGEYYLTVDENLNISFCDKNSISESCYWSVDANGKLYCLKYGRDMSITPDNKLHKEGNAIIENGYILLHNPTTNTKVALFSNNPQFATVSVIGKATALSSMSAQADSGSGNNVFISSNSAANTKLYNIAQKDLILDILKKYGTDLASQLIAITKVLWEEKQTLNTLLAEAKNSSENHVSKGDAIPYCDGSIYLEENLFYYSEGYYHCKTETKGFYCTKYLDFPNDMYSQPFETCIGQPTSDWYYKLSKDYWVIEVTEQEQVEPVITIKNDHAAYQDEHVPEKPKEVLDIEKIVYNANGSEAHTAFKIGTYDTYVRLWEWRIPVNITCSRKMWPTPRTQKYASTGGAALSNYADPYCPWRVRQKLTIRIDFNKLSQTLKMSKFDIQCKFLTYALKDLRGYGYYAVPAIIYRLYGKSMFATANTKYQNALAAKKYIEALKWAHLLEIDETKKGEICALLFNECKDLDTLLNTFKKAMATMYPNAEHLEKELLIDVFFDGIKIDEHTSSYETPTVLYGANNERKHIMAPFVEQRNRLLHEANPCKSLVQ